MMDRIQNEQMLTCHGNMLGRRHAVEMLDAGLAQCDPYRGVKRLMRLEGSILTFDCPEFELKDDPRSGPAVYDLDQYDRVIVVGAAKGVQRAALALEEILGDRLTGGHVIGKHGDPMLLKKIGVTLAGHPLPDDFCMEGCEKICAWSKDITERDLVITIAGSGISSLLTWPIEGVSIAEMREFTRMMQQEKGIITEDLNCIRTHLDRMKGGKISRLFKRASLVHLVTTDIAKTNTPVVRMNYETFMRENRFLATLADGTTFADAMEVFHKYDAWDRVPKRIQEFFLKADPAYETVKHDEYESMNARVFGLTPKYATVYPAVADKARELGYTPHMLCEYLCAEAKEAGAVTAAIALNCERSNEPLAAPCVLITSGENVVAIGHEKGVGGRNQEYCIAAAQKIAGSKRIVVGAVDTDGTDGPGGLQLPGAPNCLAGAIVDGETIAQAKARGIDLNEAMRTHGTSAPLWELGCGVEATPGISVLDLSVIVIQKEDAVQ